MTFSSSHPAARRQYADVGMIGRWRLLYLRGEARPAAGPVVAVPALPNAEPGDRADYRDLLSDPRCYRVVDDDETVGYALAAFDERGACVHRLATTRSHAAATGALLTALAPGTHTRLFVPEISDAVGLLRRLDFDVDDEDLHMSTRPDLFDRRAVSVNPALA